jgi:Holliday junction resolvase
MPTKAKKPRSKPTQTRKVSYRGAKQKGNRGENEFVAICRELGLTAMRVLGSGAFKGAASDIKVGIVNMNPDGTYPEADESVSVMRVEVKNRATNPEYLHDKDMPIMALVTPKKFGAEVLWEYLNQDKITKAVVLRRAKIPTGAISNKNYDEVGMVCMGYGAWIELMKKAYGEELNIIEVDHE